MQESKIILDDNFQEIDARTFDRKRLSEFLDKDNCPKKMNIV